MHPDLAFALGLADLADSFSLPRFRAHDLVVDTKPDLSPVTEADRAVEETLRARIAEERPGEVVVGEELGDGGPAETRWIIDPIDGTKNYSRGIPIWATLIALEQAGELTVGVASAPALGRRWWARRGEGAFADGQPIHVSAIARVEEAVVSYTTSSLLRHGDALLDLVARAWHARTFSDFWQHLLVAEGAAEIALESGLNLWDVAALQVIVEEAGGRCTGLDGRPWTADGGLVSSNGLLHDDALLVLAPPTV